MSIYCLLFSRNHFFGKILRDLLAKDFKKRYVLSGVICKEERIDIQDFAFIKVLWNSFNIRKLFSLLSFFFFACFFSLLTNCLFPVRLCLSVKNFRVDIFCKGNSKHLKNSTFRNIFFLKEIIWNWKGSMEVNSSDAHMEFVEILQEAIVTKSKF